MIILDKPYVSDFLKETIEQYQIPVLKTKEIEAFNLTGGLNYISENEAIEQIRAEPFTKIYTNSENAINWISQNLSFSHIPDKINFFKDKYLFRQLTREIFPDFYFRLVKFEDFDALDIVNIPKPFIIKPAVGFFSMAVYKVSTNEEWKDVKKKIEDELKAVANIYPKEVMDTSRFIIEQVITGDEYAFDAYYDADGEPIIVNIMKHIFASGNDFSDRLYITSEKIIREQLPGLECFLRDIGIVTRLKNFPLHVEVRISNKEKIIPIEINPLRFGAWCTTADAAWHAYHFNSIACYFSGSKPDWNKLLENKKGKTYAMMVLENSTGYDAGSIKKFDYQKLLKNFEKPIELRKIDYHKYPVFGFLFVESRDENFNELENILQSNLTEYLKL